MILISSSKREKRTKKKNEKKVNIKLEGIMVVKRVKEGGVNGVGRD